MIEKLTVDELLRLEKYLELAHEAKEAEELIRKRYENSFGIGNTEIDVYSTDSFGEYYGNATLSINGIWHYHDNWWGGRDWKVEISANGIFTLLKEAYLNEIGELKPLSIEDMFDETVYRPKYENVDTVCQCFRGFIEKIKAEVENN